MRSDGMARIARTSLRWAASLGVAACLCACGPVEPRSDRPNVVLVIVDTLRADRLGSYGFAADVSPALDALAREGVVFESVLAPSSWTRTSIGSILTSLPPRSLGIFNEMTDALDDRFTTLAEVLWAAGYWTLGATANPNINSSYRFHQGFDEYRDSNVLFPWMLHEPGKTADGALPAGRALYRALLDALARDERRPFYVQVTVMEVHEHVNEDQDLPPAYAGLFGEHEDAAYSRAVRRATDELASFVEAVTRLPGGDNTLFVVTSDHGEGLGDHPHVKESSQHGFLLYESHLRVPLILYDPAGRLPAGLRVARPVRLLDLMPTVLEWVGVEGPTEMRGRSLVPLLSDAGRIDLPEVFFAETRFQGRNKVAAYSSKWKYIENRDARPDLPPRGLHPADVREDGLRTDVSGQHPEVVEELHRAVEEWERAHPPSRRTDLRTPLSIGELRQLRELGYIE
jgi:arylsulfatase A-like enzyme